MTKHPKLELTWIGKENRPRLEPRVLLEDPEKSYHAKFRVKNGKSADYTDVRRLESGNLRKSAQSADDKIGDLFDNRLIFGDNLLALKAMEQEFAGKIKCVYIDPPYNTGSAFTHYDDGVEHSIWLSLMRDRLEILRRLLSEDGSIWVNLDDNEAHYCKVLMDEVFGRINFVANVIWQKKFQAQSNSYGISASHDHILVYAKQRTLLQIALLPRSEASKAKYTNDDDDCRGVWMSDNFTVSLTSGQRGAQYARTGHSANIYPITTPSGREVLPPSGTCWRFSKERFEELLADRRVWFGSKGTSAPRLKRFLHEVQDGVIASSLWLREEVGDNLEAKREVVYLDARNVFATPKPERLIHRIVVLATNPGDWVLDSFAGSGTTGAVAHKMGRRWIMVELGEHCHTHIIPRLKKVIDGEDQGGISKAVNWTGGGGFRYYRLAPSLLEKDKWGNWVISKEYNAALLAEALCKLEGFRYEPSESVYWQQGRSTERDFLYVTTQNLTAAQLAQLNDEVGEGRSLLVLCPAFRGKPDQWPNLTVKKIPRHVMTRCEWGHDDYSLNVANLPKAPPKPGQMELSL
jgi:adenine-specific DNA-methyltransferase